MNFLIKVTLVVAFLGLATSLPQQYNQELGADYDEALYNFEWGVRESHSGNNFGHNEQREGSNTQGSYYVLLPDSRLQKVTYYVNGDSGFVAEVTYEGEAIFPDQNNAYNN